MKVTVNSSVVMNRLEGGTIDEGGGVGSYEPEGLVRGGLMGWLSVSVVDLMGRIGAGERRASKYINQANGARKER